MYFVMYYVFIVLAYLVYALSFMDYNDTSTYITKNIIFQDLLTQGNIESSLDARHFKRMISNMR